ncbi:hypothetical protein L3Q67_24975 [Saccharothrix sp. AJ9571]|nr:hypothetical protein L3Q67_24975 [Saccharothrix sp. AJ9571]
MIGKWEKDFDHDRAKTVLGARGEQAEALEAEYEAAQRPPGTGDLPLAGPPATR